MGKTAFSGPVYGAKQTLFSGVIDVSSGASTLAYGGCIVPAGEDWYVTEMAVVKGSTGSTGFALALRDDSTTVSSAAITSSAVASQQNIVTADAGEYEGARVAAGSTLTIEAVSPTVATDRVGVCISGFRRFVSSTRAE